MSRTLACLLACVVLAATVSAQERPATAKPDPPPPPVPHDVLSKTTHTVKLNGQTLSYTATAGTLVLKE